MILFGPVLLRLKEQLGVSTDKEVAEMLGLSPTAFNDRKKRDAFPEDKLLALHAKRPDLHLDIAYILTGERAVVHAVMGAVRAAALIVDRLGGTKAERQTRSEALLSSVVQASRSNLSDEEQLLVARYRLASTDIRNEALRVLLGGEQPGKKSQKKITVTANGGQAAGRDIVSTTKTTKRGK